MSIRWMWWMNSWEVFLLPTSLSSEGSVKCPALDWRDIFFFIKPWVHRPMEIELNSCGKKKKAAKSTGNPSFRKPSVSSLQYLISVICDPSICVIRDILLHLCHLWYSSSSALSVIKKRCSLSRTFPISKNKFLIHSSESTCNKRKYKQNKENIEEYFGDGSGTCCYTTKSKYGCNNSNHKKDYCPA